MLTYWQHNALYFAFGTLWWVLLYRRILEGRFSNRAGFLFGAAAGVLANIQVFFLPFPVASVLASFLVEREKSHFPAGRLARRGRAVLGNLTGIVLMILPFTASCRASGSGFPALSFLKVCMAMGEKVFSLFRP